MKQDWTEQMRNKLEGHEQTPPAGLWEAVSEQMGLVPFPKRRLLIPVRWWWGVAAAAAVAVLLMVLTTTPAPPLEGKLVAENTPPQSRNKVRRLQPITQQTEEIEEEIKEEIKEKIEKRIEGDIKEETEERIEEEIKEQTEEGTEEHKQYVASLHPNDVNDVPSANDVPLNGGTGRTPLSTTSFPKKEGAVGTGNRSFSIALEGSGELLTAQTLLREKRVYYNTPLGYYGAPASIDGVNTFYSLTDYATKHYLPLRFGLSVQWHVNQRLALTTGLHYTYLHSEFSIPLYDQVLRDQHLHYLGLPLGLSCRLWGNSRFQIYASAGVLVEKCLNERPWQWSVDASAGAEYRFHRRISLYAEPSVGYYFDDGTRLQHYYKQHPWAPSIEVGLRLHLQRLKIEN